ncbi:MAG TPA: tocopherol cyclase family protein [Bacteroidales bacterium]|nr:tocopherol cyclase family protein [Bacteroidales bacterium]
MIFRLYKPEVFQGNLKRNNYFEGWYYKHVSADLQHVISFIPGISLNKNDSHAFIQVLDGITGTSEYYYYPLSEFSWDNNRLFLKIGNSIFTANYICLDIRQHKRTIIGRLNYINIIRYPKTLLSPGIMGWYSFIPTMECKHGIVSVNHDLSGMLYLDDLQYDFDNGKGYIEKDWGTSFPESWLWIQANNFNNRSTSFNFSLAKIPWRKKFFIGLICFMYYNNKFYKFNTYNKASISELRHSDNLIFITIRNREHILRISCLNRKSGELKAPVYGQMTRGIKEGNDADVRVALYDNENKVLYTDSSKRAGLEIIEEIFEYFENNKDGERKQEHQENNISATATHGWGRVQGS